MAIQTQYVCDGCGKAVGGKKGIADIKEEYIEIQGRITLEFWNEETDSRDFFHATPSPDSKMTFCSPECISAYIDFRRKGYEKYREQQLRDEAQGEFETRQTGYKPRRKIKNNDY